MTDNLDQQIAEALNGTPRSSDVAAVLARAEAAMASLSADLTATRESSLAPTISRTDAERHRARADNLAFDLERLGRQAEVLRSRVTALDEAERDTVRQAERAAAEAERDALAADIATVMPKAIDELVQLEQRIARSDARLMAAGVKGSAEQRARGYEPSETWAGTSGPVLRLRNVKLPRFNAAGLALGESRY